MGVLARAVLQHAGSEAFQVALFLQDGDRSVSLQDANSLLLPVKSTEPQCAQAPNRPPKRVNSSVCFWTDSTVMVLGSDHATGAVGRTELRWVDGLAVYSAGA